MIRFENVGKTYEDGFVALKSINLEIKQGELTVLIGPSGCGKSTLMKHINRLNNPTKGKIYIRDKDIALADPVELRRKIGYVIQNIGLFPHMNIAKNVAVVPHLLKWDKQKIDSRVDELLRMVDLDPQVYAGRYPSELSGGQQQRIGVIRALAAEPDIILLDEPFSALDPISREQLQDELVRLQQDLKKTIVFVTHDMDEAIKIADTIVLMKAGEIVQVGSPEHILRHPANEFVKSFIGKKRLQAEPFGPGLTVDEVMAEHPVTASPERGMAEAVKIMEKYRVDSLIIIGKKKELLGSASIFQVLQRYSEEHTKLGHVMKPFEHIVESGTPIAEVLSLMDHLPLPVVQNGKFIGLLTKGSMVRHLSEVYNTDNAVADPTQDETAGHSPHELHGEISSDTKDGVTH
ncbi:betaine/proline/choline family ABC transporter ATP-binding protein [Paenibacillus thalictri]|uniref:Quaternary amine transport ATP-binding protein n=1 Tax=Paenibacillus thalictri TaxID=2527873 RepID=A0A4Q9DTD1_9BACL|nr:betaine/proline/choline family ABC transporter ATP-binding protein [Paenibacillus thalictri]TBL79536.1 ATP-binding cassette domain-containing protein [Paenibacillus thalictri]